MAQTLFGQKPHIWWLRLRLRHTNTHTHSTIAPKLKNFSLITDWLSFNQCQLQNKNSATSIFNLFSPLPTTSSFHSKLEQNWIYTWKFPRCSIRAFHFDFDMFLNFRSHYLIVCALCSHSQQLKKKHEKCETIEYGECQVIITSLSTETSISELSASKWMKL